MDLLGLTVTSGAQLFLLFAALLLVSLAAGTLGALLGLGGGLILVPALVLLFGIDIHLAVAASLVSVVATSLGTASSQVASGQTDLRIGMFLETATAIGGLLGALVAVTLLAQHGNVIVFLFVPVVIFAAVLMLSRRSGDIRRSVPPDRLAQRLELSGSFRDEKTGVIAPYPVTATGTGLVLAGVAGIGSGLLGLGGGLFFVPAMNSFMNVPMRVASATSMFMIGVTAAAGAIVYLYAGDVSPFLAAPVVLGVLAGSFIGIRIQPSTSVPRLKMLFVIVLLAAAFSMALQGLGVLP
jgi:uncharacterized protein